MTNKLLDLSGLPHKKFWTQIEKEAPGAEIILKELWEKAGSIILPQATAIACLNALYIDTHRRIREHGKLYKNYPTKQLSKNRLAKRDSLWWVDHFTAGINQWGTLNWFSAMKIKKKSGKIGYPGASTHFIQGYSGYPFYIIPLLHGAWHEPKRNKDSIAIEMVNAGHLHRKKDVWHFWAGPLPIELVTDIPPIRVDPPFRGCKVMQPYTTEQIINNIKLKRIINAALPGKLTPEFMSAHTDWREGKTDTGPFWPFMDVNFAAFDNIPIAEYLFVQRYDAKIDRAADMVESFEYDEVDNPEYGLETPTHDDDPDDENKILRTKEVQEHLVKLGYRLGVDGKYGPKTKQALLQFQMNWNNKHTDTDTDQLKVDGLAGPKTCKCLRQAI